MVVVEVQLVWSFCGGFYDVGCNSEGVKKMVIVFSLSGMYSDVVLVVVVLCVTWWCSGWC